MVLTFGTDRPYPPTGMTTAAWQQRAPVTLINLDDLHFTQRGVRLDALLAPTTRAGGDQYPHVVAWHGQRYLEDGHSRVARAILRGSRVMRCRVHEVP